MKLYKAMLSALIAWRDTRQERAHMQRVEQELDIKRQLDYLESRLGQEGTFRVLTSDGITQAVSNEYFRRLNS
jgi:hypothetical protein